ncbi:MAG TPA: hypothetical protein PLD59_10770 [Tepidisphaeraceae bacterium]|nr:hypothetical protein [Tepidisphaeraceae bacterium]
MRWFLLVFSLSTVSLCLADRITFKDGTVLEGRAKMQPDGNWVVATPDGKIVTIDAARVAKVEMTGNGDSKTAEQLASLKRSVESLTDLNEIIARFERFATANADTPAGDDAAAELAMWRDRKARGLIRVGGDWITPEERLELLRQLEPRIAMAQQMISTGQYGDAELILRSVLELDPRQLAGLYLSGVVSYHTDKLPAARRSFEAVNEQIAGHAPTLNNLAIISFKQNQIGSGLNFFDQAMVAAPADRVIVDNVAETLHGLKDEGRRLSGARRLERRFMEQEPIVVARMQQEGQFRWGATFVDKQKFDELVAAEKAIKDKIDAMQQEFESVNGKIAAIDREIESGERELRRIEADTYIIDTNGNFIRRPLPSYYYTQQRVLRDLAGDRGALLGQQKALRQQADRMQRDLPVPKFTGTQKLIGVEGTPLEEQERESDESRRTSNSLAHPTTQPE